MAVTEDGGSTPLHFYPQLFILRTCRCTAEVERISQYPPLCSAIDTLLTLLCCTAVHPPSFPGAFESELQTVDTGPRRFQRLSVLQEQGGTGEDSFCWLMK